MFTVPGNRDIELPREGESILPWAHEITRRANCRIHGPLVVQGPMGDILVREPLMPDLIVPVPMPFEMYDDITPGDSDKNVYPMLADFSGPDTTADKVLVSDGILGDVRALGYVTKTNDTAANGSKGARGWYVAGSNGKNQIISIQRTAKMCYCQAKISVGNSLAIVDHVVPMDGGQSPVNSETEELPVEAGFTTDDGAYGIIVWDESNDVWRPLDFPCATE